MKKNFKTILAVLITILGMSVISCGSDSTDNINTLTPPSQNLTGTYSLVSVTGTILYGSGTRILDGSESVSGNLRLGSNPSTVYREVTIANDVLGVPNDTDSGTYSIFIDQAEEWIGFVFTNGAESYAYNTSGYNLIMTGVGGSSTWTWKKTSNIP